MRCGINSKISVIIPVYNGQDTIERAVMSVLDAGSCIHEIIIIDDGSDDRTPVLLKALADAHPQIRLLSGGHRGVSAARNKGIDNATGEWITFLDSDDYLESENMSAVCPGLTPDTDMAVTLVCEHRDDSVRVLKRRTGSVRVPCENPELWLYPLVTGSVWANFYRTSLLHESGLRFSEDLHAYEDLLFNIEYLKKCRHSLSVIPVSLYHYFVSQKISESVFLKRDMAVLPAFEKIFAVSNDSEYPYVRLLYAERLIRAMRHLIMLRTRHDDEYIKLRKELSSHYFQFMLSGRTNIKMKSVLTALSLYPYKILH